MAEDKQESIPSSKKLGIFTGEATELVCYGASALPGASWLRSAASNFAEGFGEGRMQMKSKLAEREEKARQKQADKQDNEAVTLTVLPA